MEILIRSMAETDLKTVVNLIRELATFENLSHACEVDEQRLSTAVFGPGACVEGLIAEVDGKPAGYALFFPNFSSFRGQRGFYLDDIYVSEQFRGRRIGEMMLREIAERGMERGFERVDFLVLDWNKPAMGFYNKLGAIRDPDERHYKFIDEAFKKLAFGAKT